MDDDTPKIFANKVIHLLMKNSGGGEFEVQPEDYMNIRVVFRSKGGSWAAFEAGDTQHMALLQSIINAWVKMPHPKKTETVV